jgi:cell wall-associated NlpC family hydrolase
MRRLRKIFITTIGIFAIAFSLQAQPFTEVTKVDPILYHVQIAAYETPVHADSIAHWEYISNGPVSVFYEKGVYAYAIGSFANLNNARQYRQNIAANVPEDAFVIAGYKGERIPIAEAKVLKATNRTATPKERDRRATADTLIIYGKELIGTPYKWGGCKPGAFDCSGFMSYIYGKVGVKIHRSSSGLSNAGTEISLKDSEKGDLILFQGTNPNDPSVGHVGMIISEKGEPTRFIHCSSSQKHYGVVITDYNNSGYPKRFIKVKRIL